MKFKVLVEPISLSEPEVSRISNPYQAVSKKSDVTALTSAAAAAIMAKTED